MGKWFTGSGIEIEFSNILAEIGEQTANQGGIYIGSDSFLRLLYICDSNCASRSHRPKWRNIFFYKKQSGETPL